MINDELNAIDHRDLFQTSDWFGEYKEGETRERKLQEYKAAFANEDLSVDQGRSIKFEIIAASRIKKPVKERSNFKPNNVRWDEMDIKEIRLFAEQNCPGCRIHNKGYGCSCSVVS